ncbi:MAG TPA: hypothetical protein VFA70_10275, partial [Dehalococcoidia bacterium]|nr:hypothetical protein [Dehalococcoidia bacterium]
PGVLSNMLAEAEFGDVTPDRLTASLEYTDATAYWTAIERGLAATVKPLAGLNEAQLAAVREAGDPALRRWRHPRTHVLRPPVEAFIGVACK